MLRPCAHQQLAGHSHNFELIECFPGALGCDHEVHRGRCYAGTLAEGLPQLFAGARDQAVRGILATQVAAYAGQLLLAHQQPLPAAVVGLNEVIAKSAESSGEQRTCAVWFYACFAFRFLQLCKSSCLTL